MKPSELYRLTYNEYLKLVKGYEWRQDQEWLKIRWSVWHIAVLSRTEEFPSFETFVNETAKNENPKNSEPQTADQMKDTILMLNQIFGGSDERPPQ